MSILIKESERKDGRTEVIHCNYEKGVTVCIIKRSSDFYEKRYIGISRCNFSAGDKFDQNFGENLARKRAELKLLLQESIGIKEDIRCLKIRIMDTECNLEYMNKRLNSNKQKQEKLSTQIKNKGLEIELYINSKLG